MNKEIIAAASFYNQSYFFSPEYDELPPDVKKELRAIAAVAAEKTRGIVCVGFKGGNVFMESSGLETDAGYDDINARSVVDCMIEEKTEFFTALAEWYRLFRTNDGKRATDAFLAQLEAGDFI